MLGCSGDLRSRPSSGPNWVRKNQHWALIGSFDRASQVGLVIGLKWGCLWLMIVAYPNCAN